MVRNIDLPECLVFYGMPESFFSLDDSSLMSLLQECQDTDTAVIVIPDDKGTNSIPNYSHLPIAVTQYEPKSNPPNPQDLYESLNSITVQPRPFGGSAGFGAKQYADPERVPLAARTVVFCRTLDQTRAAKYCGMRVLCFQDNDLADAVIDSIDFYLDEIATPGSFWLNPPNPQDENGNKVDIHELIAFYNNEQVHKEDASVARIDSQSITEMSDVEIQRILSDIDPLWVKFIATSTTEKALALINEEMELLVNRFVQCIANYNVLYYP